MIIGLSITVLIGALGLAVDTTRGYTVQSRLQGAVDAAALAGAKAHVEDAGNVSAEARMFFDANYAKDYMGGRVTDFDANVDEDSENMVVEASVTLPTTFMQIFGIRELNVSSEAQVNAAHTNLELALVVDVTGSMNDPDGSGELKIDSLQKAGLTLTKTIYGDKTSLPGVYLSLVPYRAAVNIGSSRTGWLRKYKPKDFDPFDWQGCVLARKAPRDQDDVPPSRKKNRFYPYLWPADEYGYSARYHFGPYDPNAVCPVNEIIPLTDQRETIEDGIDALDARSGGGTLTNTGLVWGWRAISPRWRGLWKGETPDTAPLDYDEPNVVKAVVFMTDGIPDIGWELMAYGFLKDGNLGTTNDEVAEAEITTRLGKVCQSMKDEGVLIFSVMFAVTDPTIEATFRNCASEPANFFNSPTGDQLNAAFEKIGRRLASLRITQ